VHKFSSRHTSGEELNNYTGIAAILRFPVQNLYELARPETSSVAISDMNSKPEIITKKTKDEEATESFVKSLMEGDRKIQSHDKIDYDEFDQWDELDENDGGPVNI
jgi:formylmethanofuran dehydrogenase subunit E-like metal-binding protein